MSVSSKDAALLGCIIALGGGADRVEALNDAAVAQTETPRLDGRVAKVRITGVTVFPPEQLLADATARIEQSGVPITPKALSEAVALIYRERGYPLADADDRPDADSGTVEIKVWEGGLSELVVTGGSASAEARIRAYQQPLMLERPVTQRTLERGLMLATDLSGLMVRSTIDYDNPEGRLAVVVQERRQSGVVGIETFPLRPDYALRLFGVEEIYGLRTGGDMLRLFGSATRDGNDDDWSAAGTVYYRTPVGGRGAYAEVFGGNAVARREFGGFSSDLKFEGVNAAAVLGYPVHRDIHGYDYILGEVEHGRAESRLGASESASEATALRLYWLRGRNFDHGGLVRFGLIGSVGVRPKAPADVAPDGDREFTHARGEFSLVTPISTENTATLRLEARAQWANVSVPHVEHFLAGHAPFLRGFAPGELAGDRGVSATLELARNFEVNRPSLWAVTPFAFISAASLENLSSSQDFKGDYIVGSAGLGTDLRLRNDVFVRAWAAWPLADGPRSDAGEPAVYLTLSKGW